MCSARTDAGNAETRRTSVLLISAPFGLRSTRSKLCLLTSPSYLVETRTRFSESIAVLEAGFSDSGVALLLKRIFPYSLCIDRSSPFSGHTECPGLLFTAASLGRADYRCSSSTVPLSVSLFRFNVSLFRFPWPRNKKSVAPHRYAERYWRASQPARCPR